MKATTAIGIVVAFVGLALGATMEGSQLPAFFNVPALVIIMSGTIGAVMASNSFEGMKAIPTLYKKAIGGGVDALRDVGGHPAKGRRAGPARPPLPPTTRPGPRPPRRAPPAARACSRS